MTIPISVRDAVNYRNGGIPCQCWTRSSTTETGIHQKRKRPGVTLRDRVADYNPDALFADGFDEAIMGVAERCGQTILVVYDAEECIRVLMKRDGMEYPEAMEFFTFNTLGAWCGENTPLFLWKF